MMNETESEAAVPIAEPKTMEQNIKKKLSPQALREIWAKDEYAGKSGTFICDPFTGKRTLQKD